MVAVAFDMIDPENGHHRQILLNRYRTEIAEVFAGQDSRPPGTTSCREQTRICQPLDDPLAVLVARTRVPEIEGPRHIADGSIRFVDDERRTVRPATQLLTCALE